MMANEPKKLGCTFEQGTRHLIAVHKGKASPIPRHPAQEIKTGTYHKIDFKNHTRLEQIEAAFHALGKGLTIDVRDAA
jgi:SHS2 domain-containing protein